MAHLIQLEAFTGAGGGIYHELWINADHIVGMLPHPKGTRVYCTHPVLATSVTAEAHEWIDVRQSPKQIRELVVEERAPRRGWLGRRETA